MTCALCGRKRLDGSDLCQYHASALENLRESYQHWTKALEISWEDYLGRIYELDNSGVWIREVIEYLRTEDSSEEQ